MRTLGLTAAEEMESSLRKIGCRRGLTRHQQTRMANRRPVIHTIAQKQTTLRGFLTQMTDTTDSAIVVRDERPDDADPVQQLLEHAFGRKAEGHLVARLRRLDVAPISLVAVHCPTENLVEPDRVVGHIMFSPVTINNVAPPLPTLGLAPVAVVPQWQHQGIGSTLIENGLARCRRQGVGVVVVLGHHDYYPRFGFRPAHVKGLTCEYKSPPENFMVIELRPGSLNVCSGLVRYHPTFAD